MKTKVEVLGYEIEIEEVDGVVTVKAELDGVKNFHLKLLKKVKDKCKVKMMKISKDLKILMVKMKKKTSKVKCKVKMMKMMKI
jgi:hypothetical protein